MELTRGRTMFKWTDRPLLPHPDADPSCALILDTDASLTGLGGVLSQVVNGQERVLTYASRTLYSYQHSYCATYRELLVVVEMVKHFRH